MTLTPEQFNKLATKKDLDKYFTKEDGDNLRNDVLTAMDAIVKKLDNIEHAFVSNMAAHDRFENRITRLEKHLNLSPYEFVIEK